MAIDYSLNINFNFYNGVDLTSKLNWNSTYLTPSNNFLADDIKFNKNNFNNSFFKLDYYDSPFSKSQKLYLTTILQASNGIKSGDIIIPTYLLDYTENTEGFYIYWLRDFTILNIDTFYVSATFFNGGTGSVKRMSNRCQAELPTNDKYNLNEIFDFYYKLSLNYGAYTYEYYDINNGSQIGVKKNPMNWFEYVTKK